MVSPRTATLSMIVMKRLCWPLCMMATRCWKLTSVLPVLALLQKPQLCRHIIQSLLYVGETQFYWLVRGVAAESFSSAGLFWSLNLKIKLHFLRCIVLAG